MLGIPYMENTSDAFSFFTKIYLETPGPRQRTVEGLISPVRLYHHADRFPNDPQVPQYAPVFCIVQV